MAKRDYYEVLGVSRDADAKAIKSAYRKLAKKYHPDTNSGDKNAEQHFKEITESYNILSDEKKRKLYDKYGHAAFDGSMGDDPEEFAKRAQAYGGFGSSGDSGFGGFRSGGSGFGGFRSGGSGFGGFTSGDSGFGFSGFDSDGSSDSNGPNDNNHYYWHGTGPDGSHQEYYYSGSGNMNENFDDILKNFFHKKSQSQESGNRFNRNSGFDGFQGFSGSDQAQSKNPLDITSEMTVSLRDAALGAEKIITLQGSESGSMQVKIPPGIDEGQKIRLKGKGRTGPNHQCGDLYIKIHIAGDNTFTRKGQDVYITADVPYTIAILGGDIDVATLHGPVKCHVPAGSAAGTKLRLRGKGIVSMKDKNRYGDEYITLRITVPKHVSEREKELLKELNRIEQSKQQRSA